MQMDFSHWMALESAMQGEPAAADASAGPRCGGSAASPGRTAGRWSRSWCSASSRAVLAVATPVLAGRVVDAIVERRATQAAVVGLAVRDRR